MSALILQQQSYFRQILAALIAVVLVTVTGSISLLWQRQQIEQTAALIRNRESDIQVEERRLRFIDTKIAQIHQPRYLLEQVARLNLDLYPPEEGQIVYIQPSIKVRQIASQQFKKNEAKENEPFRRTFDLAVMEPLRGSE